ncbi:MAG: EVE domain-containing protein, partial [Bacteroidota bacterium]
SDLAAWTAPPEAPAEDLGRWPVSAWWPRALRLARLGTLAKSETEIVEAAVRAVAEADAILAPAGLGVGYRTRDEIALFCLHAAETPEAFRTREGDPVDPLDLALMLRLLPRIEGAGAAIRSAVLRLFAWASGESPESDERDARSRLEAWDRGGRPAVLPGSRFPRTAARLALIVEGIVEDGVASYWA